MGSSLDTNQISCYHHFGQDQQVQSTEIESFNQDFMMKLLKRRLLSCIKLLKNNSCFDEGDSLFGVCIGIIYLGLCCLT